jgi:hypothetical protein
MVVYILSLDEIDAVTPLVFCRREGHVCFKVKYSGVNKSLIHNLHHKLFTFQCIKKVAHTARNKLPIVIHVIFYFHRQLGKCHSLKLVLKNFTASTVLKVTVEFSRMHCGHVKHEVLTVFHIPC